MSSTVFKGAIGTGTIQARFLSDFSNADSDLLTIAYSEIGGGGAAVDLATASPGGFATVSVLAPAAGVLEVMVATGQANDSGRLEVTRDGIPVDAGAMMDSVRWVYSVQP